MKIDFYRERILAVVAHPDDAELLCAGTLARARADGATIGICVMCQGEKGQPSKPIRHLATVRRKEMRHAGSLLGAELFLGDFPDGTLADARPERKRLIEIFRQFKPTLVFAHAPEDYHPDHQAASKLAEAATWFGASSGHKTGSPALSAPPALWWMDTIIMSEFQPEVYIDITSHYGVKEKMLLCHESQLARGKDGNFSPLSELMRLQYLTRGMQSGVLAAEAFRPHRAFKRTRAW